MRSGTTFREMYFFLPPLRMTISFCIVCCWDARSRTTVDQGRDHWSQTRAFGECYFDSGVGSAEWQMGCPSAWHSRVHRLWEVRLGLWVVSGHQWFDGLKKWYTRVILDIVLMLCSIASHKRSMMCWRTNVLRVNPCRVKPRCSVFSQLWSGTAACSPVYNAFLKYMCFFPNSTDWAHALRVYREVSFHCSNLLIMYVKCSSMNGCSTSSAFTIVFLHSLLLLLFSYYVCPETSPMYAFTDHHLFHFYRTNECNGFSVRISSMTLTEITIYFLDVTDKWGRIITAWSESAWLSVGKSQNTTNIQKSRIYFTSKTS